jgi:hypothetical protein
MAEVKCETCDQKVEWIEYSGPIDGTGGGGVWETDDGGVRCSADILSELGWEAWEIEASDRFHHVEEKTYKIVRHRFNDNNEVVRTGLTLEEAQEHCNDESTHGDGWFDGYTKE